MKKLTKLQKLKQENMQLQGDIRAILGFSGSFMTQQEVIHSHKTRIKLEAMIWGKVTYEEQKTT